MKTPSFWKSKNLISLFLYPLSLLYYTAYKIRIILNLKPYQSKIPVICIGNVVTGGAGKTPIAMELGKLLKKHKINFAYLSKGYGGNLTQFTKVNLKKHSSELVGDEPLLLAEISDAFICKNRAEGLRRLNKYRKYKYIIMDDGFQNPTFKKDIGILVLDGKFGLGNKFILPAGALREKLSDSLKRTRLAILMGQNNPDLEKIIKKKKIRLIKGSVRGILKKNFKKNKYIAFSGIARPEKFFRTLRKCRMKIVEKVSFPDHYQFQIHDIKILVEKAIQKKCKLITTKKDWVRIDKEHQNKIEYLDIKIKFDKTKIIEKFLLKNEHTKRTK